MQTGGDTTRLDGHKVSSNTYAGMKQSEFLSKRLMDGQLWPFCLCYMRGLAQNKDHLLQNLSFEKLLQRAQAKKSSCSVNEKDN